MNLNQAPQNNEGQLDSQHEKQEKQSLKLLGIEATIIMQDMANETDPEKIAAFKKRLTEIQVIQQAADAKYSTIKENPSAKDTSVWGQAGATGGSTRKDLGQSDTNFK